MKQVLAFLALLIFVFSCQKDKEILSGDIEGIVNLYNVDYSQPDDRSGVSVELYSDGILKSSATTDSDGKFQFIDVPYGRYHFNLQKDSFVELNSSTYYDLYHVGGSRPTVAQSWLFRVPDFEFTVDSLVQQEDWFYFDIFWKIDGDIISPYIGYPIMVFCSNIPDVSKDNYISYCAASINWLSQDQVPYATVYYSDEAFEQLKTGTIYVRCYPVAYGQSISYGYVVNPAAIGKPSNVDSFVWKQRSW